MKATVSLIIFFLSITSLFAQEQNGTIVFKETRKLDIELPENVKAMNISIPKESTSKKVLHFNGQESVYTNYDSNDQKQEFSPSEGEKIEIRMQAPQYVCYKNLDKNSMKEQKEIMGKLFLVEDQTKKLGWKMTGKQKKVLDYLCQEATTTDGEDTISAWFTSQIPVSNGPGSYGQLPGMILEVSVNDGKQLITASEITLGEYDAETIVEPKKGKKVSEKQYQKIKEEKRKEMQKMYGGSGNVIIQEVRQ